eukprot:4921697-Amphidinium_carterae.1
MSQFPGACHEPHCGAGIQLRRLSTCPICAPGERPDPHYGADSGCSSPTDSGGDCQCSQDFSLRSVS